MVRGHLALQHCQPPVRDPNNGMACCWPKHSAIIQIQMHHAGGGRGHVPPLNLPRSTSHHLSQVASDQIQACQQSQCAALQHCVVRGAWCSLNQASTKFTASEPCRPPCLTWLLAIRLVREPGDTACVRAEVSGSPMPAPDPICSGPKQYTACLQTTDSMHFSNIDSSSSITVTTGMESRATIPKTRRWLASQCFSRQHAT